MKYTPLKTRKTLTTYQIKISPKFECRLTHCLTHCLTDYSRKPIALTKQRTLTILHHNKLTSGMCLLGFRWVYARLSFLSLVVLQLSKPYRGVNSLSAYLDQHHKVISESSERAGTYITSNHSYLLLSTRTVAIMSGRRDLLLNIWNDYSMVCSSTQSLTHCWTVRSRFFTWVEIALLHLAVTQNWAPCYWKGLFVWTISDQADQAIDFITTAIK